MRPGRLPAAGRRTPRIDLSDNLLLPKPDTISQAEFGVRAEPHQAQRVGVRLLVNQHQVGFNVAISVILPVPGQRMIAVPRFQRLVAGKRD